MPDKVLVVTLDGTDDDVLEVTLEPEVVYPPVRPYVVSDEDMARLGLPPRPTAATPGEEAMATTKRRHEKARADKAEADAKLAQIKLQLAQREFYRAGFSTPHQPGQRRRK